jgi:hypothetical protein
MSICGLLIVGAGLARERRTASQDPAIAKTSEK